MILLRHPGEKYGGYAIRAMNGKHLSVIEQGEEVHVHIVEEKRQSLELMIYKQQIRNLLLSGIQIEMVY